MIGMLKWEAKILNKLFQTNAFKEIVLEHIDLNEINYNNFYQILSNDRTIINTIKSQPKVSPQQIVQSANTLCQPKTESKILKDQILKLNQYLIKMNEQQYQKGIEESQLALCETKTIQEPLYKYSIEHVIIYSSLSKCRIWPKMLKSSTNFVLPLVTFYNQFTKDFSNDLFYKFDPIILSHKFEKAMNKIQQKKKSFPQLFYAIQQNNEQLISQLLEQSRQTQTETNFINQFRKDHIFVCHHVVIYADLKIIRMLHEKYGLNFQKQDQQKQTAIFYAVKRNSFEIVQFLTEEVKVNINHKQYQNRTPIYLAAFQGNLKIVDYLYSKGANPQMESKLSRTPLSKACYLGNVSVAEYLIKIGVNLTTIDSKGRTALHNAAWGIEGGRDGKKRGSIKLEDSPECAQLLLLAGHPPDLQDFDGFTPLMSAAASLAIKSMRVLVKYGANLNHKTKRNESLVFVAAKYGHLQCVRILIEEFNCDYEEANCFGITPLDASLTSETAEVCNYLLELYFNNKKSFSFQSMIKCLCYYKKQTNLSYLKDWARQNQSKKDYIYKSLKYEIQSKDNFIADLFQNQKDLLPCFLDFFQYQIDKLDQKIVQFIVDRSIAAYKKGDLQNFPEFLSENEAILKQKNVVIRDLQIEFHTKEDDVIKLLSVDTNLTENYKSVHRFMLFLVKRRMTKVLLWILTLHDNPSGKLGGLYKFSKKEIEQIVRYQTQEHNSIQNYCYIHGIYDAVKILELEQKQVKIYIPKYKYSYEPNQNHSPGILFPVKQHFFDLKYLLKNHFIEEQAEFYQSSMSFYDKRINQITEKIQTVENLQSFHQMKEHFKKCRLIGIDIQHWNHSHQDFVCLVQVSGLGQTFLIDALKIQKQQIKQFLEEILADEDKIKVFHSYDQDLKWIGEDFYIDVFKSVVDTSKIYGILSPKNKSPSLKLLAQIYLSQHISKDFQRSDWRIRPLFKEMIVYAGTDALLLPFLYLKQLMESNVEVQNEKDAWFFESVRKTFGCKRHIKCGGRINRLQLL